MDDEGYRQFANELRAYDFNPEGAPMTEPAYTEQDLREARPVAAKTFYGKESNNLGCVSSACKNCEYGSSDWLCELCELQIRIAAEFARLRRKKEGKRG